MLTSHSFLLVLHEIEFNFLFIVLPFNGNTKEMSSLPLLISLLYKSRQHHASWGSASLYQDFLGMTNSGWNFLKSTKKGWASDLEKTAWPPDPRQAWILGQRSAPKDLRRAWKKIWTTRCSPPIWMKLPCCWNQTGVHPIIFLILRRWWSRGKMKGTYTEQKMKLTWYVLYINENMIY